MPENTAGMKILRQVLGSVPQAGLKEPNGRHDPTGGRTCSRYFHEANFAKIFEYDVCGGRQDNDHKKSRGACPTA